MSIEVIASALFGLKSLSVRLSINILLGVKSEKSVGFSLVVGYWLESLRIDNLKVRHNFRLFKTNFANIVIIGYFHDL